MSFTNQKTNKWQHSDYDVIEANTCICSLIEERLSIVIDKPTSQGGTSATGNVVRRCMLRDDNFKKDFLYWILTILPNEHHEMNETLYNYLGAILRIYNSGQKVNPEELDYYCKEIDEIILEKTVHNILSHYSVLIDLNNGERGLKDFSEEGLES